ncbi:GNAT family N-acetyltransferase [Magnetospira thiophila]
MPDGNDALPLKVHGRIGDIPAAQWDACAGDDNPFVSHAFLSALEDSGSVRPQTGWAPCHLTVEDETGQVQACAPLYLKGHSYGEYVFDWSWADAYRRAGQDYYPKLLCAVPFTPATGPRLMRRPGAPESLSALLAAGMIRLAEQQGCSSIHANFLSESQQSSLQSQGFMPRLDIQYHWDNPGYADFDDFLETLSSRKRKAIRKERRQVAETDIDIRLLSGNALEEAHWDAFYQFYLSTSDKKWGSAYLNRTFFSLLGERMADRVVLVMGFRNGQPVAGALNLRGRDTLFGRNWGCLDDVKFLHFEMCYYQAIDYAISQGLRRVEAGAQGQHKIQRGYRPNLTHSAHWIADPRFAQAIGHYLEAERQALQEQMVELAEGTPYRKD